MKTIAIIGGGASGLIAASVAARNNNKVIVFEKRSICGKKILVTGNGRCNYWNSDQDMKHYYSNNKEVLEKINTDDNRREVLNFFDRLGIIPYIKNGYYYPYSKEASTVKNALLEEAIRNNVEIVTNFTVKNVKKENGVFIINQKEENIKVDSVILATGSLAYYKDEEAKIGYEIAKSFGHDIVKVLPSLVQLKAEGAFFKEWAGIRSDVIITINSGDEKLKEEEGEILLTDYGISGICVFNISGIAARLIDGKKDVVVKINFIPWYEENNFVTFLDDRQKKVTNLTIGQLLEGFLNSKLVKVLLKLTGISRDKYWQELSNVEKELIVNSIQDFSLKITGTNSFDKAQVCSGGVRLSEINPYTMESKKEKGLYIIGELLDVDGDCGGYNLGFSFLSGIIAGKSVGI